VASGEGLAGVRLHLPRSLRDVRGLCLATGACLGMAMLALRAASGLLLTVPATGNIYRQQVQMGLFLAEYYQGAAVAANDVGAINYLADLRCLDIVGLGSREVSDARARGTYTSDLLGQWAAEEDVRIALAYDWYLREGDAGLTGAPDTWVPVARWSIESVFAPEQDTITLYAVGEEPARLLANVREFSERLPAGVRVELEPLAQGRGGGGEGSESSGSLVFPMVDHYRRV